MIEELITKYQSELDEINQALAYEDEKSMLSASLNLQAGLFNQFISELKAVLETF